MTAQQQLSEGLSHHRAGRLPEAKSCYLQVLAQQPNHAEALHLLGLLAQGEGKLDEALSLMRRANELRPNNPSFLSNMGNVLAAKGQFDEAVNCYQRAIQLKPDFAGAHSNLGSALKDLGRHDDAMQEYRRAIALNPNLAEAHINLGDILTERGQLDEAIEHLAHAIRLNPAFARAQCNLGVALQRKAQIERAMDCYREAIRLDPNFAKAHNNLGIALRETGNLAQAIAECLKAVQLQPDFVDGHWSLALALLLSGDLNRGLAEYEWRWQRKELPWTWRKFPQPRWDGQPLKEQTLLLFAEQGLGDTIQFIRYLPMVKQRVRKVVLACPSELKRLILPIADGCEVVEFGRDLPAFDVQCPLPSLPLVFGTELATIPTEVPYLPADETAARRWAQRLGDSGAMKIGIAWAGSRRHPLDRQRSMPVAAFAPLANIPGITLFSLQKGEPASEFSQRPAEMNLIDHTSELADFADTAALIHNLDLVISVDTAIAHLAGAMGKPVWILLPFAPDWRWMLGRDDSPWYPTMHLFRQTISGDWGEVIQRVADSLRNR